MKPQSIEKQLRLARSNDPNRPSLQDPVPAELRAYHTDGAILIRWPCDWSGDSCSVEYSCTKILYHARRDCEYHKAKEYPLPTLERILESEHPGNVKNPEAKGARYRSPVVCLMPDGTLEVPPCFAMPEGALVPLKPYYLAILVRLGFKTVKVWSPIEPVVAEHPTVPGAVAVIMPCRILK